MPLIIGGDILVALDGEPVRSCLMFAAQADGASIRTVEDLADGDALSPLQQAFSRNYALQCGYCTPGILRTLTALRDADAWPTTEEETREVLSGNICRCTGYQSIVDAILEMAK